jgi:hypothetical protein
MKSRHSHGFSDRQLRLAQQKFKQAQLNVRFYETQGRTCVPNCTANTLFAALILGKAA